VTRRPRSRPSRGAALSVRALTSGRFLRRRLLGPGPPASCVAGRVRGVRGGQAVQAGRQAAHRRKAARLPSLAELFCRHERLPRSPSDMREFRQSSYSAQRRRARTVDRGASCAGFTDESLQDLRSPLVRAAFRKPVDDAVEEARVRA
jgi:hypothetical protein